LDLSIQLVTLPRKPTVAQLLHSFKKEILAKDRKEEQQLEEVVAGLKLYFNRALGAMLLYRFERQQYTDLRKKFPKKEMSDIYGAEHLLRIFGNIIEDVHFTETNLIASSKYE
jgi:mortality factor 4-like protein 1